MAPQTETASDDDGTERRAWHAVSAEDTAAALDTGLDSGLSDSAARKTLDRVGPNTLPEGKKAGLWKLFLRQFGDPLIYVLLVAAVLSALIGNFADAAFILAVLLVNAGLGTYQENRAQEAASALKSVIRVTARVLRDGRETEIDAGDLVPGDVVLLEAGGAVPADIRLDPDSQLRVDESMLTGESVPVGKDGGADIPEDAGVADRETLAHAGTSVVSGSGRGIVVRTGLDTEIGQIADALGDEGGDPPLVVRMRRFTRVIAVAVLGVVLVLGGAQWLQGGSWQDILLLSIALAVSAIPAGLPVAITVALSIASNRMAARNVIVRNLPAVEGLGTSTVIASDKTGTLTENRLTARAIRGPDGETVAVTGDGEGLDGTLERDGDPVEPEEGSWLHRLLTAGALANEARLERGADGVETKGDRTDVAFLVAAGKAGLFREDLLDGAEIVGTLPYDPDQGFGAAAVRDDAGRVTAHVKGGAEIVAGFCGLDEADLQEGQEALADEGHRVLAVAAGEIDAGAAKDLEADALRGLDFLGFLGLMDPVREGVAEAVAQCRDAGVEVRMITGDHPSTARAIARDLGIDGEEDRVLTGPQMREKGADAIRGARIHARTEPAQKTEIVSALQEDGHFVAVTGDGVNDAPALRAAQVGVAMGEGGTDVARDAADLILTDDNFASVVAGIEEGRVAYDNVRKVVWLLISTGVAEVVLFTLSVAFGTALPLTAIQLLWLNLVTNGIQDIALAFEKGEPGVLKRKPRRPDERILDRLMVEEIATSGLYMGLVAFAVFWGLTETLGYSTEEARNLLLLLLVLFENVHAFNVRSERRSAFRVPLSNNWLLVGAVVASQAIHLVSMFIPGWSGVLGIAPVTLQTWAVLLAITLSKFAVVEAYKAARGARLAEASA